MSSRNPTIKLAKSAIALTDRAPVVGEFASLFEDLNEIWSNKPELLERLLVVEADMIENLARLIDEKDRTSDARLDVFSQSLADPKRVIESLRDDMDIVKTAIGGVAIDGSSRGMLTLILSCWLSYGLRLEELPDDFGHLAHQLEDLDLRILLYFYERARYWQRGELGQRWTNEFQGYHAREVASSLSGLCQFGFLIAQANNEMLPWTERAWEPEFREIDGFGDRLRLLPIVAIMPLEQLSTIARMVEREQVKEFIDSLSQSGTRVLSRRMTCVRRHPFGGYQWQTTDKTDWTGDNWQYQSCDEAIVAANEILRKNGQEPEWYYVSV